MRNLVPHCLPQPHTALRQRTVKLIQPDADFSVLFLHNEGYSTMCGHGIIAVTTVVLETGMLACTEPETVVRIDTPAGLVTARARVDMGRVTGVLKGA